MIKKCIINALIVLYVVSGLWNTEIVASTQNDKISVEQFGKITMLESGRKKPVDTYARNKLMQFSGRQKSNGVHALDWFAKVLFDPVKAENDQIFLINNPDVADALGIPPRAKRRYTFSELHNASEKLSTLSENVLKKDPNEWSSFEKEIVLTWKNFRDYLFLRSFFSFLEPDNQLQITDSLLSIHLGLPYNKPLSYLNLLYKGSKLAKPMQEIAHKTIDSLTNYDLSVIRLTKRMYGLENSIGNPEPHIIPVFDDRDNEHWFSLWGLLNRDRTDAMNAKTVNLLIAMRECYILGNQRGFDDAIQQYRDLVTTIFSEEKLTISDPRCELIYNKLNPFLFSRILYGLAALFALLTVSSLWSRAYHISLALCLIGLLLHTTGLLMRMLIMSHPPVTNLYETFVFTAWALVLLGIILEWIRFRELGIITASITGFLFLHIAARYARDGDTMGMLSAILDSSFWLTSHIVTIALGYAGFVAAGLIGHIYLIKKVFTKTEIGRMQLMARAVYGIFVFGFIFTIIGTLLGGMWADQAWGRFWGWDPKENGALLIIIWGLIVLHLYHGRLTKDSGLAIGAVVGVILVMCTWIGVNLLGVGLHSYGFSGTGAGAFFIYMGVEIVFLFVSGTVLLVKNERLTISGKSNSKEL
ncbi:MAG: cytochrome c biogenesis protein CcsA [Fibrobacter sp.]|nr:cytochrome c biogenesis protein CcsA [Fibrobacter sp.]